VKKEERNQANELRRQKQEKRALSQLAADIDELAGPEGKAAKLEKLEQIETTPAQVPEKTYGIAQALDRALEQTPEGETLFIVPTYTGLLELHRELERRGLTPRYWEETGP
jgi:hypothetical protein